MDQFNYYKFSLHLRNKAAEFRLNVTATAKEIGISKATLSRFNREIGVPDIYSYYLCCKWLQVNMQYYFSLKA